MVWKKCHFDPITATMKGNELIDVAKRGPIEKGSTENLEPFEISGVYLLDISGIVISHKDVISHPEFDEDVFGSTLTALKIYIEDALHSNSELRDMDYGGLKILIEEGNEYYLVVVGKGDVIEPVRESMSKVVKRINKRYGEAISRWDGNVEALEGIGKEFDELTGAFAFKQGQR